MSPAASVAKKSFMQTWYRLEVLPIVVIIGGALGGAGWYVSRLARGPDVVWDRKNNPAPWLDIDQKTNVKLFAHTDRFDKSYSRDKL